MLQKALYFTPHQRMTVLCNNSGPASALSEA